MARRNFLVKLDIPPEASIDETIEYIKDAVCCWRGSLRPPLSLDEGDPGDPMWDLNTNTVEVFRANESIHNRKTA